MNYEVTLGSEYFKGGLFWVGRNVLFGVNYLMGFRFVLLQLPPH
jgi:hypothetical protein